MTEKLTRPEAAEVLRVSVRTFDKLKHRAGFPRMISYGGKKQFYMRSELISWDEKQRA